MSSSTRDTRDVDHQLDNRYSTFQEAASEYLIRHRSIIDVLSKIQESSARVNRSVVKAVTSCGCISVNASRQELPNDITYWEMKNYMSTHLDGEMCEQCKEVLELELGALCLLGGTMRPVLAQVRRGIEAERKRVTALGMFNLT